MSNYTSWMEITILIKNLFFLNLTTNEHTVNRQISLFGKGLVRINTQAKMPITHPEYMNLFYQNLKTVGSFTRVFTVKSVMD